MVSFQNCRMSSLVQNLRCLAWLDLAQQPHHITYRISHLSTHEHNVFKKCTWNRKLPITDSKTKQEISFFPFPSLQLLSCINKNQVSLFPNDMPINVAIAKVRCSYIRSWWLASSAVFLHCFFQEIVGWVETVFQLHMETELRHATYHMLISHLTIVPIDHFHFQIHFLGQEQAADCPTDLTIARFKISSVRRNWVNNCEHIHSLKCLFKENTNQNFTSQEYSKAFMWNLAHHCMPIKFSLDENFNFCKVRLLQTISQQGASSRVSGPYRGMPPQQKDIGPP